MLFRSRKGDVRRAKLYYLRDLRGKAAKIREKRGAQEEAKAASAAPKAVVVEAPVTAVEVEAPAEQA